MPARKGHGTLITKERREPSRLVEHGRDLAGFPPLVLVEVQALGSGMIGHRQEIESPGIERIAIGEENVAVPLAVRRQVRVSVQVAAK